MATRQTETSVILDNETNGKMNAFWIKKTTVATNSKRRGRPKRVVNTDSFGGGEGNEMMNLVPSNLPVVEEKVFGFSYTGEFLKDSEVIDNLKPAKVKKVRSVVSKESVVIKNKKAKLRKKRMMKSPFKGMSFSFLAAPFIAGYKLATYSKKKYGRKFAYASLSLLLVFVASFTAYAAYSAFSISNQDIIRKVGSHVVLPMSETPKVYVVKAENVEILGNPLFAGVKTGDNVLNYEVTGKIFIYRPGEDKIVNIINTK